MTVPVLGRSLGGVYHATSTINFPTSAAPQELIGNCDATIIWDGDPLQPAIRIHPSFPGSQPGFDSKQILRNIHVHGGRVDILSGGKMVYVENLSVTGVAAGNQAAVILQDFSGGHFKINAHENYCDGILLDRMAMLSVDITSRHNVGRGVVGVNSFGIDGWCYTESNQGYNQDWLGCKHCELAIHMEAPFSQAPLPGQGAIPFTPLPHWEGKRRKCQDMRFTGNYGQSSHPWNDDTMSALFCIPTANHVGPFDYSSYKVCDLKTKLYGALNIFGNAYDAGTKKSTLTIHAGDIDAISGGGGCRLVDVNSFEDDFAHLVTFEQGDYVFLEYKFSSPEFAYLRTTPIVPWQYSCNGAPTINDALFADRPETCAPRMRTDVEPVTRTEGGQINLQAFIFAAFNHSEPSNPSQDVTLNWEGTLYRIPAAEMNV